MCEYAAIGKNWGLVKKFDHLFLDFGGKKHYLIELREKEWNVNADPRCIDGMRVYYEAENKRLMSGRLKQLGVKDAGTRVEIILEVKRVVERRFGNALRDSEELAL